jgi:Leu/Phe-tRNA-protein transferase
MREIQLGIYPLSYHEMTDARFLREHVYPNMRRNYYWSEDFSPEYYIAQAKAGFIAVTDSFEGRELLLPEIQFSYAILHFDDLHISRNVRRILKRKDPQLTISTHIDSVVAKIQSYHRNCWLTPRYHAMLKATQMIDDNFQLISAFLEEGGEPVAGEIGYIIGNTYTSLSGFSSREKLYRDYGTTQLVLLGRYLQENGFAFWNMGQTYMPYKFHLGARQYDRTGFLHLWHEHI